MTLIWPCAAASAVALVKATRKMIAHLIGGSDWLGGALWSDLNECSFAEHQVIQKRE
jgi:hypothetical protein